MSVTQAQAVFDLLHWLNVDPVVPVDDERARRALRTLADHASKRMQLTIRDVEVAAAIERKARPDVDEDLATCRVCGCTDAEACPGGCWWVPDPELLGDLCSSCLQGGEAS